MLRLPLLASLCVWIDFLFLGCCDKNGPKANPTANNVLISRSSKISLSKLPVCSTLRRPESYVRLRRQVFVGRRSQLGQLR